MLVSVNSHIVPLPLRGPVAVDGYVPRFWATLWLGVFRSKSRRSTERRHLAAVDRFYVFSRSIGFEVDDLIAHGNFDALDHCLIGFLSQLRNQVDLSSVDHSQTWASIHAFCFDLLRYFNATRVDEIESRLFRLAALYRQLRPRPSTPQPPIRALPTSVVEDLYEVFDPSSPRNPFKSDRQRWRNLLVFSLMLRLGLRRSEVALLRVDSFKEDFDPAAGKNVHWLDVDGRIDGDTRSEAPSLKTTLSRRQIPVQSELVTLAQFYIANFRGRPQRQALLLSQKGRPLSLRSISEIFEICTKALSEAAHVSLSLQGLGGVSCHDLRHTCAVVRMQRYQESGDELDRAQEKLRAYFGWARDSQMPRLYARAYFETRLSEVWNEGFDQFVDALRQTNPEGLLR